MTLGNGRVLLLRHRVVGSLVDCLTYAPPRFRLIRSPAKFLACRSLYGNLCKFTSGSSALGSMEDAEQVHERAIRELEKRRSDEIKR